MSKEMDILDKELAEFCAKEGIVPQHYITGAKPSEIIEYGRIRKRIKRLAILALVLLGAIILWGNL